MNLVQQLQDGNNCWLKSICIRQISSKLVAGALSKDGVHNRVVELEVMMRIDPITQANSGIDGLRIPELVLSRGSIGAG